MTIENPSGSERRAIDRLKETSFQKGYEEGQADIKCVDKSHKQVGAFCSECLDEARADERRKGATMCRIVEKEAYAKGKADANEKWLESCHVLEDTAYAKGQADLIEKLLSKETIEAVIKSKKCKSYVDYNARDVIEAAIKKAGEKR